MANTIKLGNGNWATKEGSLLAYNDENNNFKPLPFTTTRASSATVVNKQGLIETVGSGIPRIDFSDDAKGALKLEPQRTNLVTYSEDFSQSAWTKSGTSVVNGFISPDGTNNAFKLVEDTSTLRHSTNTLNTVVGEHTLSVFAKKGEKDILQLSLGGASITPASTYSNFDLTNGTITAGVNTSSDIEEFANGWYRCSITSSVNSGVLNSGCVVANSTTMGRNGTYQGDGTSGVYIYGAQLEQGSYATSYIPTQGTTQTRVADTAIGSGNSTVINSTEGVLYAEIAAFNESGPSTGAISLNDGGNTNRVKIELDAGQIKVRIDTTAGQVASLNYTIAITNYLKIAVKWKTNDYALWVNGIEGPTDTSGASFVANTLSKLSFNRGDGNEFFKGKTKSLQVYNTALSDAELTTLTTI